MDVKRSIDCLRPLVRRRPMYTKDEVERTPLDRCLGTFHLTFYSVASMAGGGIYVLTGSLIGKETGAAACISYVIAGISAAFTAMCYAEFAILVPRAGSVYIYTYLMLGELPAFLIGWTTVSDVIVTLASIAKAFSGTVDVLAHSSILNWTEENIGTLSNSTTSVFSSAPDIVALTLIIAMMIITATGAHLSLTLNCIVTGLQLSCLFIISFGCYIYGSSDSWSVEHGGFAPYGFQGIMNGATIAIFAFSGFDSIANASEETINPRRTIPRAMLASLIVITVLYFMASLGMALLVPREDVNFSSPFVSGFLRVHVKSLVYISAIGTLLATSAAKITVMFVVPRMLYAIACDGLIFRFFGIVEKRTQVPLFSLVFGGSIAGLLALLINIQTLAEFTSLGFLFSYFTIGVDIMILRYVYDMPSQTSVVTTVAERKEEEDEGEEVNVVVTEKESGMRLIPLRERFEGFGDRHPIVRTKKFFITLLIIFIGLCFVLAIVIDLNFRMSSSVLIGVTAFFIIALLLSAASMAIYQPTVNDEIYQSPLMPSVPLLTIAINAVLITRLPPITWLRFVIWSSIGLLIYVFYGRKHSKMAHQDQTFGSLDKDTVNEGINYGLRIDAKEMEPMFR